jgi:hypothetical protein
MRIAIGTLFLTGLARGVIVRDEEAVGSNPATPTRNSRSEAEILTWDRPFDRLSSVCHQDGASGEGTSAQSLVTYVTPLSSSVVALSSGTVTPRSR